MKRGEVEFPRVLVKRLECVIRRGGKYIGGKKNYEMHLSGRIHGEYVKLSAAVPKYISGHAPERK